MQNEENSKERVLMIFKHGQEIEVLHFLMDSECLDGCMLSAFGTVPETF